MHSTDQSINCESMNGFLNDFKEADIIKPPDGLNGVCIITYGGEHSNCMMEVKLVNGKRDGEALILKDELPFMRLKYWNGMLMGSVERLNEEGQVELRGQVVNGKECGLFEEYDDCGTVVWRGYYRNGKRYSKVVRDVVMVGAYNEVRVADGKLLSVAMYDDNLRYKNGYCMEFRNDERVECFYENGVKRRGKAGECELETSIPTAPHLNSLLDVSDEATLIVSDLGTTEVYGVSKVNEQCLAVNGNQVILADLSSHDLCVYEGDVLIERVHPKDSCVDLNVNGMRWEGGVKDGMPLGYGILYSEEGRKRFEGFMINGKPCCYGKEYYPDLEMVHYEGCYCNGKRFGKGVLKDRSGAPLSERQWMNDQVFSQFDKETINNRIESFTVPDNSYRNINTLFLPYWLCSLKRIQTGDYCFSSVRSFVLDGLGALETVTIGKKCFTLAQKDMEVIHSTRKDGVCRIMNCPKLSSIRIGAYSFADYRQSFELSQLPSLQLIDLKEKSFSNTSLFSLTDLSNLQSVSLRENAFNECQSIVFSDIPNLRSITLGLGVFSSDGNDDRRQISNPPFNYKNNLVMRNLPSLTKLNAVMFNFFCIGSVILENIPSLSASGIQLGQDCFRFAYSLQSSSMCPCCFSCFDAKDLTTAIRSIARFVKQSPLQPEMKPERMDHAESDEAN